MSNSQKQASSKGSNHGHNDGPTAVEYQAPFLLSGQEHTECGHTYRLAGPADCLAFRNFADSLDGFTLQYNKDGTLVWDKKLPGEPMHVIKVFGVFPNATTRELYDMLHDAVFRETWDNFRQEAFRVVRLNENNDIGYYAAKSPMPMVANRDFVNQRMWHDTGRGEYIIFNTSVPHSTVPPSYQKDANKNKYGSYVRAISKLTGYLIRPWTDTETGQEGACLTYLTQSDPCGWIPATVTNYVTTKFAPKTIINVREALVKFREWFPKQVEAGSYEKDWDIENPSWWLTAEEEEQGASIANYTIDFAHQTFIAAEAKKKKK